MPANLHYTFCGSFSEYLFPRVAGSFLSSFYHRSRQLPFPCHCQVPIMHISHVHLHLLTLEVRTFGLGDAAKVGVGLKTGRGGRVYALHARHLAAFFSKLWGGVKPMFPVFRNTLGQRHPFSKAPRWPPSFNLNLPSPHGLTHLSGFVVPRGCGHRPRWRCSRSWTWWATARGGCTTAPPSRATQPASWAPFRCRCHHAPGAEAVPHHPFRSHSVSCLLVLFRISSLPTGHPAQSRGTAQAPLCVPVQRFPSDTATRIATGHHR